MELTALALRSAAQKLCPYFQAHPVVVLTDQPLRNFLHKPDLTGRMLQWAIELSEFGIEFQPRLSMKGQVMAYFVLEYARRPNQHQESNEKEWWTLQVDGASRSSGSEVGLLLQSSTWEHLEQAIRLGFPASTMKQNMRPSYPDWTSLWLYPSQAPEYLRTGTLTEDPKQAYKVGVQAARFTLIGRHLYKRSFTRPYLRCLSHSEAQYVLAELHEGICGNHSGGRSLAHRAHSQGYYWPTMKKDAATYVKNVINVKGRSHKQNSNHCLKEKARTSQRKVGGRVTQHPMGLSNHTRTTNRKHSLRLAYGMDAVIPTEIGLPTIRTEAAKQDDASVELGRNLDWADEVRESAAIRMADYQQRASSTTIAKEQACQVASSLHPEELKGQIPFNVILLHTAAIAEEEHIIHLLLVVRFKLLPLCSKLTL
ncbi:hypothetical protein CK203_099263 [Vitis vinifera]|uniref:Integrase zinc-binding domain-containing protein n=1 Tax=Vitis vinifera TaxID=29760 RepID=A0A438CTV5_VITVI|nr:hypothetical protein CK203_099263 [Vitis vinifera]